MIKSCRGKANLYNSVAIQGGYDFRDYCCRTLKRKVNNSKNKHDNFSNRKSNQIK